MSRSAGVSGSIAVGLVYRSPDTRLRDVEGTRWDREPGVLNHGIGVGARGFVGVWIAPAHLLCLHHHDEHLPVAHAYLAIFRDDGVHELEGYPVPPPFLAVLPRGGAERHVAVVLEVDPRVFGIG